MNVDLPGVGDGFALISSMKVESVSDAEFKFVVSPLMPGFGITLGNAMRRVLLSSVKGSAVSSVEISGVIHEFSFISGVKEDVTNILLNIKQLVIRNLGVNESGCMHLNTDSSGPVTAAKIDCGGSFEVVNKDLVICNLSAGSTLEMKMNVTSGRGYVSVENNLQDKYSVNNVIPIDVTYGPVKCVNFSVNSSRVGNFTDYDELILQVGTNMTITPQDAVSTAAKILQDQFKCFTSCVQDVQDGILHSSSEVIGDKSVDDTVLLAKVEELDLSVRSYNCLKNANIVYISDLVNKSLSDLLKYPNFGKKSANEIQKALSDRGLSLCDAPFNFSNDA